MKRILAATAALAAVAVCGSAAAAQTASGTLTINASVSNQCAAGSFSSVLTLGDVITTSTGRLDASTIDTKSSVASTNFWCNGTASTVQLTATPLTTGTGLDVNGFGQRIDYTVTASGIGTATGAGAAKATTSSSGGVGTAVNAGLFDTAVTLTLSGSTDNGKKLVAAPGSAGYSGAVTVTVTSS